MIVNKLAFFDAMVKSAVSYGTLKPMEKTIDMGPAVAAAKAKMVKPAPMLSKMKSKLKVGVDTFKQFNAIK